MLYIRHSTSGWSIAYIVFSVKPVKQAVQKTVHRAWPAGSQAACLAEETRVCSKGVGTLAMKKTQHSMYKKDNLQACTSSLGAHGIRIQAEQKRNL
jgi:hypothetical protein